MKKAYLLLSTFVTVCTCGVQGQFLHPGCLHSATDFDRIEKQINDGSHPRITQAWNAFAANWMLDKEGDWLSAITGNTLKRGIQGDENFAHSERDFGMCYIKAIYWKLRHNSPNAAEREKAVKLANEAVTLLNKYANRITGIGGNSNSALITGFQGWQVANAGEILRDYPGWKKNDFLRFKQWVYDLWFDAGYSFAHSQWGQCDSHYMSNWDAAVISTLQAIGIFLDDPYIYNYAMMHLKQGNTNASLAEGVCGTAPEGNSWKGFVPYFWNVDSINRARGTHYVAPLGYLNQNQESTRDQGHAQVAVAIQLQTMEQAWNQGDNVYDFNNRIMAGAVEYTAGFCGADAADSTFLKNYPVAPWWTDCGLSETYQPGLGYGSRGNRIPGYQIALNHFANRMGLNMTYTRDLHEQVCAANKYGVEQGAGDGAGQNFSDIAGFGDLMHNEDSATAHPTLLRGMITLVGGSTLPVQLTSRSGTTVEAVKPGVTYRFSEMSNIADGSVLRLQPTIMDGSDDTGRWSWDDDPAITTREREVTIDTSKVVRARYINKDGVESVQLFVLHREGDGFKPSATPYYVYAGQEVKGDTVVSVKKYDNITIGVTLGGASNVRSRKWEKQNGSSWAVVSNDASLKVESVYDNAVYRMTAVMGSGVTVRRTFHIGISELDQAIEADGEAVVGNRIAVAKGGSVKLLATPNSVIGKAASVTRVYQWYVNGDSLRTDTLTFHYAADGKTKVADVTDTLKVDNIDSTCVVTLDFHRILSGKASEPSKVNFIIDAYEANVIGAATYYIKDASTGKYLENKTMEFYDYDAGEDNLFRFRLQKMNGYEGRYVIKGNTGSLHVGSDGKMTTQNDLQNQTFNLLTKVGDNTLVAIKNPETIGSQYWGISGTSVAFAETYCVGFPFEFINVTVAGVETPTGGNGNEPVSRVFYTLDGRVVEDAKNGGLYILRTVYTDGSVKTEKLLMK